jgi:hypothetical protein
VSNTLPTGLVVTNCSDGKVHQAYVTQSTAAIPKVVAQWCGSAVVR